MAPLIKVLGGMEWVQDDDAKNGYTIQKPKMLEAGDLGAPRRSR